MDLYFYVGLQPIARRNTAWRRLEVIDTSIVTTSAVAGMSTFS